MLMLPELPLFTVPVKRKPLPDPPCDTAAAVMRDIDPDDPVTP